MIRVHVYNWISCSWQWVWRPATVVRAMRHLTFGATIVCSGITVWPPSPPVEAHPPPPQIIVPPPAVWAPPPSPFGYLPPGTAGGAWTPVGPIPLGPVLEMPPGLQETQLTVPAADRGRGHEVTPPDCDTPPEKTPVAEPATFGIFSLAILVVSVLLRRSKPVVPEVRWVVLTSGGKS